MRVRVPRLMDRLTMAVWSHQQTTVVGQKVNNRAAADWTATIQQILQRGSPVSMERLLILLMMVAARQILWMIQDQPLQRPLMAQLMILQRWFSR